MPSQIVHHILGFLKPCNEYLDAYYDDEWQTDLLACSQVSKSWRKLALKYLFTSLVLRFEGCDPSLEYDQKMGTYSPDTKTLRRFERLLKDFPGGLASVTQHLSLKMVRPSGGYSSYLDPTAFSFMSLLKALPALRTLRLRDVCLNSLFGTTPALFEYTSPVALESLYIHYSQRRVRPSQLMHLLSCFGTILELHLEDFKPDVIACDGLVMEPPSLRVSSLFIWNMRTMMGISHQFALGTFSDCVQSLYVAGIHTDEAQSLSWLLHNLCSLQRLTLNLDSMHSAPQGA